MCEIILAEIFIFYFSYNKMCRSKRWGGWFHVLSISYTTNKFPSEYVPTFDNYAVTVTISGKPYTLRLFDTSKNLNYVTLCSNYIDNNNVLTHLDTL